MNWRIRKPVWATAALLLGCALVLKTAWHVSPGLRTRVRLARLAGDPPVKDQLYDDIIADGAAAIPTLRRAALETSDEEVGCGAAYVIWRRGGAAAREALYDIAVHAVNIVARRSAIERVASMNDTEPFLAGLLERQDCPAVKACVAFNLRYQGTLSSKAIGLLEQLVLSDEDLAVRQSSLGTLATTVKTEDIRAPFFDGYLHAEDSELRLWAAFALARSGSEEGRRELALTAQAADSPGYARLAKDLLDSLVHEMRPTAIGEMPQSRQGKNE